MECSLMVSSVSVVPENRGMILITFNTSSSDLLDLLEESVDVEEIKEKFNLVDEEDEEDDE